MDKEEEIVEVLEENKSQAEIEFEQQSDKNYCLEAIKQNSDALHYVKDKTIFLKIMKKQTGDK